MHRSSRGPVALFHGSNEKGERASQGSPRAWGRCRHRPQALNGMVGGWCQVAMLRGLGDCPPLCPMREKLDQVNAWADGPIPVLPPELRRGHPKGHVGGGGSHVQTK